LALGIFLQVLAICALPSETDIPPGATSESGWRCFYVEGPLPFDAVGILAGLTAPLAAAISIFSVFSYKTDYLLVRLNDLEKACVNLIYAGYSISEL
jgi:hypothetical protein